MAFSARARAVGRAAAVVVAFYLAFFVLLWGALIVEWIVLEGLRWLGAFGAVHAWAAVGRGIFDVAGPGLVAALGLYAVLSRRLHRLPATWGWPQQPGRRAAEGLAWGLALAAATLLFCVTGGARISGTGEGVGRFVAVALPVAGGLAAAALLEELLFRGFPLARLAQAAGRTGAALALSLLFAFVHVWNPQVSALGVVNIGIASLLLSVVFFLRGGLAAAWGLHTGWNAGLVLGGDAPVSGLAFRLPAIAYDPGPREWLTGGRFGPEGGLAATIVLGLLTVWWGRHLVRPAEGGAA